MDSKDSFGGQMTFVHCYVKSPLYHLCHIKNYFCVSRLYMYQKISFIYLVARLLNNKDMVKMSRKKGSLCLHAPYCPLKKNDSSRVRETATNILVLVSSLLFLRYVICLLKDLQLPILPPATVYMYLHAFVDVSTCILYD